jgi:hypothetical protein
MTYNPGTVTVTMKAAVSATLAADLGLSGAQNAAGQVLALPYRDAKTLVQAGAARFGSAAIDAATPRTNVIQVNTHSV